MTTAGVAYLWRAGFEAVLAEPLSWTSAERDMPPGAESISRLDHLSEGRGRYLVLWQAYDAGRPPHPWCAG